MRVNLSYYRDQEYIGNLYIGAPSQRATVVLDTGSCWLNIKACLSSGICHKAKYEEKPKAEWPTYMEHYRKTILKDPFN